jgi:hypothetical protein
MSWFRVDDMSAFHKKVLRAGNAAWGAFCRMGAHSSHYELDGFVPNEVATVIATREEVDRLLEVGFLKTVDGGFQIHDFLEWNPSAAEVAQLRRKRAKAGKQGGQRSAARRQASPSAFGKAIAVATEQAAASAKADTIAQANEDHWASSGIGIRDRDPGSDLEMVRPWGGHSTQSEPRLRTGVVNASADGAFGMAVNSWADGIRSVTGKPFVPPRGGELGKLLDAFDAHAPAGADRIEWAREAGGAYARARAGEMLNVHRFMDWLNSDRAARGLKMPSHIQRAPAGGSLWEVGKKVT